MHQIELPDLLGDMFDAMRVLGLVTNDFNRHDSIDSNASSTSTSCPSSISPPNGGSAHSTSSSATEDDLPALTMPTDPF